MFDIHATSAAAYSVAIDGEEFRFLDANRAALELTGFTAAFQPGLTPRDVFPADTAAAIVARYRSCAAGHAVSFASTAVAEGEMRQWQTTLFPIAGIDGTAAVIIGICGRVDETSVLPALALEALDGGFWTFDLATRGFQTSRGLAERIAGPGHESLNLAEYVSYVHADDLILDMPDDDNEVTVEFRMFTFDGRLRWMRTRRRTVRDDFGRATHIVGIVLDITDQKLAMMQLAKDAATDNLTHVANRRAFERAAERCFGGDRGFGVVVIDLDDFKPVNDRYGHLVGDELLRQVGRRLARLETPGDLLSRIGGDEFALLLPDTTQAHIDDLLVRVAAEFVPPFRLGERGIVVGVSCGSAIRCASDRSVGDIVARADRALYGAKEQRRRLIA